MEIADRVGCLPWTTKQKGSAVHRCVLRDSSVSQHCQSLWFVLAEAAHRAQHTLYCWTCTEDVKDLQDGAA